jgi:hypothetical protein
MNTPKAFFSGALSLAFLFVLLSQQPSEPNTSAVDVHVQVPVGGIILWWGAAADIPEGFEACDGKAVVTKDAVLRGNKPDLENKFARGAPDWRRFIPQAYKGGGGDTFTLDSVAKGLEIEEHALTSKHLPKHHHAAGPLAHSVTTLDHTHPGGAHTHELSNVVSSVSIDDTEWIVPVSKGTAGAKEVAASLAVNDTSTDETGGVTKTNPPFATGSDGGGQSLTPHPEFDTEDAGVGGTIKLAHTLTARSGKAGEIESVPAYVEVVYLIRVK